MIQDGQKIVLDSFTNFKFMMGEKTRFSKLMKWIKDTQDDVHFIHKGTVLSTDHPTVVRNLFRYGQQVSPLRTASWSATDNKLVLLSSTVRPEKMSLGAEYKIS